ncbi:lipopolysaccharide export LptBFGC system permease protein LptF [Clostridium beijerinckii]|uniref:hypothetical protein n=1 Tax=Clostridium beijerinckii TaxID=1520 RepID=UPI0020C5FD9D|nr:hypothetical protein [Clostridium beijerinckii]NRT30806.1 lipopolysaccharide export LptBFGC system permease protein LptF [Clostridium beijerinckii]
MMTKYFKSFILFFLICLSFHLFTETIVYAEQQTNEISQKTNESTLHNSTNEDSSKNTNKDISTSVSSNESEKDSKKTQIIIIIIIIITTQLLYRISKKKYLFHMDGKLLILKNTI